jgi:hypothetical protein
MKTILRYVGEALTLALILFTLWGLLLLVPAIERGTP